MYPQAAEQPEAMPQPAQPAGGEVETPDWFGPVGQPPATPTPPPTKRKKILIVVIALCLIGTIAVAAISLIPPRVVVAQCLSEDDYRQLLATPAEEKIDRSQGYQQTLRFGNNGSLYTQGDQAIAKQTISTLGSLYQKRSATHSIRITLSATVYESLDTVSAAKERLDKIKRSLIAVQVDPAAITVQEPETLPVGEELTAASEDLQYALVYVSVMSDKTCKE